jgi:hypothetical protein
MAAVREVGTPSRKILPASGRKWRLRKLSRKARISSPASPGASGASTTGMEPTTQALRRPWSSRPLMAFITARVVRASCIAVMP